MSSVLDGFEASKDDSLKRTPSRPKRVRRKREPVIKEEVKDNAVNEEEVTNVPVENQASTPKVDTKGTEDTLDTEVPEDTEGKTDTTSTEEVPEVVQPEPKPEQEEVPVRTTEEVPVVPAKKENVTSSGVKKDTRGQIKVSRFSMERLKAIKSVKRLDYNNEAFDWMLDIVETHGLSEQERTVYDAFVGMARQEFIDNDIPLE